MFDNLEFIYIFELILELRPFKYAIREKKSKNVLFNW